MVTLTTDFGARDPYVASMKGVLFQTCPNIQVIDLSHDISPQDVLEGSLFLAGA
ncbi:MAG: SAM-dependent chlorinase/fluorinase, partial [bacterium]|nr:SAM-dependent chlorinase/fluorinase [bacterium]